MTRQISPFSDPQRPDITVTKADLNSLQCLLSIHATAVPTRELPDRSSSGDQTAMRQCFGTTATIPPPIVADVLFWHD